MRPVPTEGLGELGGLAVTDRVGGLRDRRAIAEEVGRALHSDPAEVAAEAAVSGLGEGALQLAGRGKESPRNLVKS